MDFILDGIYYEDSDIPAGADPIIVDKRPSEFHIWAGGQWIDDSAHHYRELRAREYPPMTDYLDAVVKGDEAAIAAYIAACKAVKEKYPKP